MPIPYVSPHQRARFARLAGCQRSTACPFYEWHGLIVVGDDNFPFFPFTAFLTVCCRQDYATNEHEWAVVTDQLHSIRDAAARLAISPWTVRRLINRRDLQGVRVGRRVLISEKELLRVIRHGAGDRKRRGSR